jgi:hypothetical protein
VVREGSDLQTAPVIVAIVAPDTPEFPGGELCSRRSFGVLPDPVIRLETASKSNIMLFCDRLGDVDMVSVRAKGSEIQVNALRLNAQK